MRVQAHAVVSTRAYVRSQPHSAEITAYMHYPLNARSHCCVALRIAVANLSSQSYPPAAAMSFVPNTELSCQICDTVYANANAAFVLNCADEGCRANMCLQCLMKGVFANPNLEKLCPHCRRPATSYSYAFFSAHKSVTALRDKVSATEAKATRLKKKLTIVQFDAEQAVQSMKEWDSWASASKSAVFAMPSTELRPPVVLSPRARSRSPRPESDVRYVEYNG